MSARAIRRVIAGKSGAASGYRTWALLLALLVLSACGAQATPTPLGLQGVNPTATASAGRAGSAVATPGSPAASPAARPAGGAGATGGRLVIYSARKEELMKPVVDAFQRQTGIQVTLKSGSPGELALLIGQERGNPQGDVFFTTDAAGIEGLRQQGLLEPYKSPNAEKVPAEFKAADGGWTGVIGRSRNIMYNTNLVKPEDAPKSIFELTDPKWKGKVAIASIREGGVRLWLSWLVQEKGEDFTVKYIKDLQANGMKVLTNHTEVQKAVGRGEFALGLVNHYYYVFEQKAGSPVGLIYPDQGASDIGTLVTPLAVGIVKGAKNGDAAKRFVDFMLSAEGQQPLTTQESEFPLLPGVGLGQANVPGVRPIDQIKRPTVDFTKLADVEKRVVEVFTPLLSGGQ